MIIFAPEEAEIFKDYLFILARFSVRLPLFSYDLKTIFLFSDVKFAIYLTKIKVDIFKHTAKKIRKLNEQIKFYRKCMVPPLGGL